MKTILKIIAHLFLFTFLTITTQIGGLTYFCSLIIKRKWKLNFKFKLPFIFTVLYLITALYIVPVIAPYFGREKIKHTDYIHPTNLTTVLLNRNYVTPELNRLLTTTSEELKKSNIKIYYLDANFPFIDKFPLLPHLSHNDGKKIDLSFIYETKDGAITHKQKSISGYGIFEKPRPNEFNQIDKCLKNGYFQYDYPKYLTFGNINNDLVFSKDGTHTLIKVLLRNKSLGKLFIEPHLKKRMNISDNKIRYHGCGAVRHDDHIHIQLK